MKVKKLLYQVRDARREIDQLNEALTDCYLVLLPSGIRYDLDKVQTSPGDMMTQAIANANKYEQQIRKRIAELSKLRADAFNQIERLEDTRHRQILQLFFLSVTKDGKPYTMSGVADAVGYSRRQTYRLYNEAIQILESWQ